MSKLKSNTKQKRVPMWLPYLKSISENRQGIWTFEYNGGKEETSLNGISTIMIYGDSDVDLPMDKIEKITRRGIPIVFHRRNMAQPIYIVGGLRPDADDTISFQLRKRQQNRYSAHIARQLLSAKMKSMAYLVPPEKIPPHASVKKVRQIEAVHAKKYWRAFFAKIGHPEWNRRGKNPASTALDAASKFVAGIILRWTTYHHLSPYHGFLHITTEYPSLVYDLMEPYRGLIEAHLLKIFCKFPEKYWVSSGIDEVKDFFDDQSYVPLTRQIVSNHELFHGAVLSLKYYLLGRQKKFLIPLPGKPNGGRPPKVDFLLYGRAAGKSNFWKDANQIAQKNQ